jgi:hypothetical protein
MDERLAIDRVEERYGTLEEFAMFCMVDAPEVLSPDISGPVRAKMTGLDGRVLDFLLTKSPKFRALMRSAIANTYFGLAEEAAHVKSVVAIATNKGKKVVSNKGHIVEVDNSEKAVIEAGRYLNEYRGTPLESSQRSATVGVQVIFGGLPTPAPGSADATQASQLVSGTDADGGSRTVTVAGHTVSPHSPLRPGQLPPPSARSRYGGMAPSHDPLGTPRAIGSDLDFATSDSPTAENPQPAHQPKRRAWRSGRMDRPAD